jgi:hypothetical protein
MAVRFTLCVRYTLCAHCIAQLLRHHPEFLTEKYVFSKNTPQSINQHH